MGITKYFTSAFAASGTRTPVPDTIPVDDKVNYPQGWTPPYSYPEGNPGALFISRSAWNQVMYDATLGIQQYQQNGIPNFITTADNLGVPYPYAIDAMVLYNDGINGDRVFQSLVNNNIALPTVASNWVWVRNSSDSINYQNVSFDPSVTMGMAVYRNAAGTFFPAIANGTSSQNVIGFANTLLRTVTSFGRFNNASGLVSGTSYYLSPTVAGSITSTSNLVNVGIAQSSTTLLVNVSLAKSIPLEDVPFERMHIRGMYVTAGFNPTRDITIYQPGECRDLSHLNNIFLPAALTNKSILSTWAAGNNNGCVPSNILVSWLAGAPANATVHGFIISPPDGYPDFAIDTSITGANILADPIIQAAGYTRLRRIASWVVPAAATIRPIYQWGEYSRFIDNISSFSISPAFVANVGAVVNVQLPSIPSCVADVFLLSSAGGGTFGALYIAGQTTLPTPSANYRDNNGGVAQSGVSVTAINKQIGYIQTTNSTCTINVSGWHDYRDMF